MHSIKCYESKINISSVNIEKVHLQCNKIFNTVSIKYDKSIHRKFETICIRSSWQSKGSYQNVCLMHIFSK